jgi:hypothetical protein
MCGRFVLGGRRAGRHVIEFLNAGTRYASPVQ